MKTRNKILVMEGREITRPDRSAECEELLLMKEESDKRVRFLQYINTALLTLILTMASMTAIQLTNLTKTQATQDTELQRIKTIQDYNTVAVVNLDSRLKTLELNRLEELKVWVEQNYVRKAQK